MNAVKPTPDALTPSQYEQHHVHNVYESIASHFSQTRYKPWPIVADFLSRQPLGSIGLDAGAGNGKYLHGHNITNLSMANETLKLPIGAQSPGVLVGNESRYLLIGLDRSLSLMSFAQNSHSTPELVNADCLSLPFRSNFNFDFAISIATLHHLSTHERRLEAMKLLLSIVRPRLSNRVGRLLVFVWAHEQGEKSRRMWTKGTLLPAPLIESTQVASSSDCAQEPQSFGSQDVLVPWVLNNIRKNNETIPQTTYNRYYHLFREGELMNLVKSAAQSLKLSFVSDPPVLLDSASDNRSDYCLIKNHGWEADNWWIEAEIGSIA
ncbi:hypothetical protein O181_022113 [Austropuccinia psidii MF-1]|uniref:Methyltransferase type 11 domain-containing protein n=1 Tax=Austropuccinia psidii MF-1 TaxID=1389203 RepID=A0A9Q3CG71_9BASI|nr:hypothetical protein [Austropuccinia psidii MF-1]